LVAARKAAGDLELSCDGATRAAAQAAITVAARSRPGTAPARVDAIRHVLGPARRVGQRLAQHPLAERMISPLSSAMVMISAGGTGHGANVQSAAAPRL
jgi:hypothetical protein